MEVYFREFTNYEKESVVFLSLPMCSPKPNESTMFRAVSENPFMRLKRFGADVVWVASELLKSEFACVVEWKAGNLRQLAFKDTLPLILQ